MKYRTALAISFSAFSTGSYATALCQEKEQDIQRGISYAEKHNNRSCANGLNKALSEVRANCTDSKLRVSHQKKIAEQKNEITECQHDLAEAKQRSDAEKVAKREHKLARAQQKLEELETRDY